jgi:hypothetical protein
MRKLTMTERRILCVLRNLPGNSGTRKPVIMPVPVKP